MIARKNYLRYVFIRNALAVLDFRFIFYLNADIPLQQRHKRVFLQYVFPKVRRYVVILVFGRRVACIAYIARTVRTLIERQKERVFFIELCRHPNFV